MRLAFLILLTFASAISADRFSCYLGTWAVYLPGKGSFEIEDVPGDLCTHAIYSFVGVNENNWEVLLLDEEFDIGNDGFSRFVGLKKTYPGLKTTISVGGWGEFGKKYSDLVSSASRRATFIKSAVDLLNKYGFDELDVDWEYPAVDYRGGAPADKANYVTFLKELRQAFDQQGKGWNALFYLLNKYGFDGLDVDWEYPAVDYRGGAPADKANYVTFLKELRQAFDQQGKGWELTVAVTTEQSVIDIGYDISGICQYVDYVHAMTYDMHGDWDGVANVHSPLHGPDGNAADGIDNWINGGCPASKMVIGVPFYGKSFNIGDGNNNHEIGTPLNPNNPSGDAGPYTQSPGTLAYYEICDYINNDGWTERWDDERMVPFAYKGHNWVGYENPRSAKAKADYVKSKGLGGTMTWSIDTDDFLGTCGETYPLSRALRS